MAKLKHFNLILLFAPLVLGFIGVAAQYSVSQGDWSPWAFQHLIRLIVFWLFMVLLGFIPLARWYEASYILYIVCVVALLAVTVFGIIGGGAKRWIFIANQSFQPSELAKFVIFIALARFLSGFVPHDGDRFTFISLVGALFLLILPISLVFLQPDLGTAALMIFAVVAVLFLSGFHKIIFFLGFISSVVAAPILWLNLHSYQKSRILSFLSPESDPQGAGYHTLQSKIAFGSGGIWGRGFIQGPQTQLNFLPEAHTDFIFTVIGEEFGLVGSISVTILWSLIIFAIWRIAMMCRQQFGRITAFGFLTVFFLYFFINNSMVLGLLPVVGIPMPFVSYGGSSMLSGFFAIGILQSISVWCYSEGRLTG